MSTDEPLLAHGIAHVTDLVDVAPMLVQEVLVEGSGGRLAELQRLLERRGVAWRSVDRRELTRVGGRDARLAVARLHPFPYVSLDELLERLPEGGFVVALDGVTDPGNLGAIVRSAVFFGATAIVLPERNSASVNAAVVRRSAGAVLRLPVVQVTNLVRALERLKGAGFWVYGTETSGGVPLGEEGFAERTCLVLGSEGRGMRPLVARHCDGMVALSGGFESLNVAACAAVLFYEWAAKKNLDKAGSRR